MARRLVRSSIRMSSRLRAVAELASAGNSCGRWLQSWACGDAAGAARVAEAPLLARLELGHASLAAAQAADLAFFTAAVAILFAKVDSPDRT